MHPRDQPFTKEEVVLLLKGEYYSDDEEEDDDQIDTEGNAEVKVDLNRAMLVGKNDVNKELEIDDFEALLGGAI